MFDHNRMYGTKIRVIRIFNTYGPYMHPYDGRVVTNFIIQALQGKDITIYGDGSQTRSFQFIPDLLEGIFRMMNNSNNFLGPVNLGNPCEFTIAQLATQTVAMAGSSSKVVFKDLPADDPKQRKPDLTVANAQLSGWNPVIPLAEGLKITMDYFRTLDLSKYSPPTKNWDNPNPATLRL